MSRYDFLKKLKVGGKVIVCSGLRSQRVESVNLEKRRRVLISKIDQFNANDVDNKKLESIAKAMDS